MVDYSLRGSCRFALRSLPRLAAKRCQPKVRIQTAKAPSLLPILVNTPGNPSLFRRESPTFNEYIGRLLPMSSDGAGRPTISP